MATGALPAGFSHLVLRTVVLPSQSHWSGTGAPRGSSTLNTFLGSLQSAVCPSGSTCLQGILGSPTQLTKPAPSRGSVHAVRGWRLCRGQVGLGGQTPTLALLPEERHPHGQVQCLLLPALEPVRAVPPLFQPLLPSHHPPPGEVGAAQESVPMVTPLPLPA